MLYNIDWNKILHLRIEGDVMHIQIPTVLLDGTVLAALSKEDMYGYALTKIVQESLCQWIYTISGFEKIEKEGYLETYMMNLLKAETVDITRWHQWEVVI